MNDTADHYQAAEGAGEIISTIPHHDSSSPQATIIGWSSQAALIPVVHQDQARAPSPMCVASAFIDTMNQQSVMLARYSEDHPNYPYPSYIEAPSASALYQRSITPEASPPYMSWQHRPMIEQGQETWSGNSPSDYPNGYEYSEGTLCRMAPFQAQAQGQVLPCECEYGSCHEHFHHQQKHDSDLDLDLDCPFHDYSVKSLRARELFIAHVPVDMNEEELKDLCSQYGDIMSASIMFHDMGVSRCYGYVMFEQQSAADDALLKLNHHEVSSEVDLHMRNGLMFSPRYSAMYLN